MIVMDRITKWSIGLQKTRSGTLGRLATLFGLSEINEETWEDLEATLIQADLGVETTLEILKAVKKAAQEKGWTQGQQLRDGLTAVLTNTLIIPPPLNRNPAGPTVILIVGVNGSGKTTSIAKLAQRFKMNEERVLLGAADTYRAAAVEQLETWADRLDIRVVSGQPESDPGAVAYDTVSSAVSKNDSIVLIDTAGRLHTRYNLMEEIKKVYRVCAKPLPGAPHEVWLVLDATTGQNALLQARAFLEAVTVSGIILTKMDSSAKGGMAFAIQRELGLPIQYIGLGEKAEDLIPFDREAFVESILAGISN
jgi:fused signal recognition particle receptor